VRRTVDGRDGFPPGDPQDHRHRREALAAENRLNAEELAALAPGDTVTIESGLEFARRRHSTGTVARITGRHVVVRCGSYVECYGLRDGIRDGGAGRAELVHEQAPAGTGARQRHKHIDAAYRSWSRSRTDPDRLRQLQDAVTAALEDHAAAAH
jgi:hypothetical protein